MRRYLVVERLLCFGGHIGQPQSSSLYRGLYGVMRSYLGCMIVMFDGLMDTLVLHLSLGFGLYF